MVLVKLFGLAIVFGVSTTQLKADDWLVSIGFSDIPSETIDDKRYSSTLNANLWFGAPQAISFQQGIYINAALPEDVWNNRSTRERTAHTFVNLGFTFSPADEVILYAGPGFAYQRINQLEPRNTRHRYRLNGNIGASY